MPLLQNLMQLVHKINLLRLARTDVLTLVAHTQNIHNSSIFFLYAKENNLKEYK